jgi:hypothetical protein
MTTEEKRVPLTEAATQVRIMANRLALMHLAYAKTLMAELGEDQAKKTILKAIMAYGRMVGERNRAGLQDLPFYGLHDHYSYHGKAFVDTRELPVDSDETLDWQAYQVHGCALSEVFKEYGETELGCLYCFVDAAKSMATGNPDKLIHTACEVTGDSSCRFKTEPVSPRERQQFDTQDPAWQAVDPLLVKGGGLDEGTRD